MFVVFEVRKRDGGGERVVSRPTKLSIHVPVSSSSSISRLLSLLLVGDQHPLRRFAGSSGAFSSIYLFFLFLFSVLENGGDACMWLKKWFLFV